MPIKFILVPIIGAVIGYFTNWLAIKMLFRPHNAVYLFGFKLPFTPGLIPKERGRLADKVGSTLSSHVLTPTVIEEALTRPDMQGAISGLINGFIDNIITDERTIAESLGANFFDSLTERVNISELLIGAFDKWDGLSAYLEHLDETNPALDKAIRSMVQTVGRDNLGSLVSIFVDYDKAYLKMKSRLIEFMNDSENRHSIASKLAVELEKQIQVDGFVRNYLEQTSIAKICSAIPEERVNDIKRAITDAAMGALKSAALTVAQKLDISKLVTDKINEMSLDEAENLILSVVSKELKMITLLGGLLGFILGFVPLLLELF